MAVLSRARTLTTSLQPGLWQEQGGLPGLTDRPARLRAHQDDVWPEAPRCGGDQLVEGGQHHRVPRVACTQGALKPCPSPLRKLGSLVCLSGVASITASPQPPACTQRI